jgi:hypothetical protein
MHATIRFRQQLPDDRVEVFDACPRHAALVRGRLAERTPALGTIEGTPPADAACPYDGPSCGEAPCDRHDGLIAAAVEDGHLMGTS